MRRLGFIAMLVLAVGACELDYDLEIPQAADADVDADTDSDADSDTDSDTDTDSDADTDTDTDSDTDLDADADGDADGDTDTDTDTDTDADTDTDSDTDTTSYCDSKPCWLVEPTNQAQCYDELTELPSCPSFPCNADGSPEFCGQDAQYPDYARSFVCQNTDGTTQAPCDDAADDDETVVDSLTGLEWQRTWAGGMTWQAAFDYCATTLNEEAYGGHTDWRLPSYHELAGIVDYGRFGPALDTVAFKDPSHFDAGTGYFWTSSSYARNPGDRWWVNFGPGGSHNEQATRSDYCARCVRGSAADYTDNGRYTVIGDPGQEVVIDNATSLEWAKVHATGQTWQQALAHCESLDHGGHADWRLPNVNELRSLANVDMESPATEFPDMPSEHFWSSSSMANSTGAGWFVQFEDGYIYGVVKSNEHNARCVRGSRSVHCRTNNQGYRECHRTDGRGGPWIEIPGETFWMGCRDDLNGSWSCSANSEPQHEVRLSSFGIDKFEITQEKYKAFIDATGHRQPNCNWDPTGTPQHPVVCADLSDFQLYCRWLDGDLPTEAQWEYAARGPMTSAEDYSAFPWGTNEVDCARANYDGCAGQAQSIGVHPLGASPFGIEDLGGNVWEWTLDWFQFDYYSQSPPNDPQGPADGTQKVIRGGSFGNHEMNVCSASRNQYGPDTLNVGIGARCVRVLGGDADSDIDSDSDTDADTDTDTDTDTDADTDSDSDTDTSEYPPVTCTPNAQGFDECQRIDGVGGPFIIVPEATFWMGCREELNGDNNCEADGREEPQHEVHLSEYGVGMSRGG